MAKNLLCTFQLQFYIFYNNNFKFLFFHFLI